MKSEFILAFNEIAEVRKLPREVVLEALKAALVSAYRRDTGISSQQGVEVRIDERSGAPTIWSEKEVVEDIHTDLTEVKLEDARLVEPDCQLGDMVYVDSTPADFGRIAAQTAKQVILQRMREAERDAQFMEFAERVGDLVTGTVQSTNNEVVTIGLGRAEAILPRSQQMPGERYRVHEKVRAYVMEVKKSNRGPQIVVSRTHRNMLRRLLEYEVPEIYNGTVEIKSIAREPGARSKVAVAALQPGADPVGACVGMRGVRIQSIVKELNGEKIDVIEWNADQGQFILKALSPARVSAVFLDDDPDEGRTATVVVPDDQLSLAIGREGQNARLAAKLTGWRIDIKSVSEAAMDAYQRLSGDPSVAERASIPVEMQATIELVAEKKAAGRAVLPEEYQTMVEFVKRLENARLHALESTRSERRAEILSVRERIPEAAYAHPLDDTDLRQSIYSILTDAGYKTVGEVMALVYLSPDKLLALPGFGMDELEAVQVMVESIDFTAPIEVEAPAIVEEAAPSIEPVEALAPDFETQPQIEEFSVTEALAAAEPAWDDDDDIGRARRAELVARMASDLPLEIEVPASAADHALGASLSLEEEMDEVDAVADSESLDERDSGDARGKKAKERARELVYDEELGRVVAKRRRKRGDTAWEGVEE